MTDNKQFQQVSQATWDMVNSFREANRTIADSVMAMQPTFRSLHLHFSQYHS